MNIFHIHTVAVILLLVGTSPVLGGALHDTAGKGDTAAVKSLLEAGANIKAKDNHGWTALSLAVMRGDTAIVKPLKAAKR